MQSHCYKFFYKKQIHYFIFSLHPYMYYPFWTFFTFIYYTVFSITFNFSVYNGMFKNSPSLCYLWNISEKLLTTMFTPARQKTCFCTLFFLRIDSNCPLLVNKVQLRFYRTVHSCCEPFIIIQYFNQLDKFKFLNCFTSYYFIIT